MQNFITALKAEHIKKKGTGIYYVSAVLGAISPIIFTIIQFFEDEKPGSSIPYSYYLDFFKECMTAFTNFFFPLLIIITVSRVTQLDHKNGGWQLMETQPVKKLYTYFSKFTITLISNIIAILALVVTSYLGAWLLGVFTDIPKDATTDLAVGELLNLVARLFAGALFLTALQYVISVLMPSFIWSILIGFFLLLLYIFLNTMGIVPNWYPIELISSVSKHDKGSQLGYWFTYSEAVSVLSGSIVLYIGFEWYRHKKFVVAFFGKTSHVLKLAAVLVVFGGLLLYTLYPNTMEAYERTVLTGKVEGDTKISKIYVTDNFVDDTIAVIPVKNNSFHYVINQKLGLDKYNVSFDGRFGQLVSFGSNDSLYFDVKSNKTNVEGEITGTRIAENQYVQASFSGSAASYYIQENINIDDPAFIMDQIVNDYKEDIKGSNRFKTVDNYVPRKDFKKINNILLTIRHLNVWHDYLRKREAMYPQQKTEASDEIKAMIRSVPLNSVSLLSNQDYFTYVRSQLIQKNKKDLDENTKALMAVARLESGQFKDKMLYWQLNKSLEDASTSNERIKLIGQYGSSFSNPQYLAYTINKNKKIESLSKGMPAPTFEAVALDGRTLKLADLKGKFIVIDVWATWCGPCREQSPKFETLAIKYKQQNVQFIALSIDQRMDSWVTDAKSKSKSVLQLHIKDEPRFSREYDVPSIPRFIFIDPQGNFINSQMPYPSDKVFEKLLREEFGLAEER